MKKTLTFNSQRYTACLYNLLFIFLVFLFSGCGGDSDDSFSTGSFKTGSAFFTVSFHDTPVIPASENQLIIAQTNTIDCELVSNVICEVSDESDDVLTFESFACTAGNGTIDNIPAGTNRKFVIFGENDAGEVFYYGEAFNRVTITPGQTTDVGTIIAQSFVPTLISPNDGESVTIKQFSLNWNSVQNAHEYRIMVSTNSDFSTTIINQTTSETTFTPSGLSTSTTYFWKVYARDINSNQSGESLVRNFTTIPDAVEVPWYRDADLDGYGDPNVSLLATSQPSGYVSNNGDCNDNDESINPGEAEACGDNIDNNCNDLINENVIVRIGDNDGYGYGPTSVPDNTTLPKANPNDQFCALKDFSSDYDKCFDYISESACENDNNCQWIDWNFDNRESSELFATDGSQHTDYETAPRNFTFIMNFTPLLNPEHAWVWVDVSGIQTSLWGASSISFDDIQSSSLPAEQGTFGSQRSFHDLNPSITQDGSLKISFQGGTEDAIAFDYFELTITCEP